VRDPSRVAVPDRDSGDFAPLEGGVIDEDTDVQQGLDFDGLSVSLCRRGLRSAGAAAFAPKGGSGGPTRKGDHGRPWSQPTCATASDA
jgi:hypothetical protein